ncbi:MAG TPA: MBL fold metallo-hydrolase [Herpetosiphonaceae bacterium]
MELQLIRNATMRLRYAGRMILTDPDLAPALSRRSFTGRSANPMIELPLPAAAVLDGIELALVSHLHQDHFDAEASRLLPPALPLACQPADAAALAADGFAALLPVADRIDWGGVAIERVPGQHGSGDDLAAMGEVSGFVLAAPGEPTVYWAGDSIWCPAVAATIARVNPAVIITHSSGALWQTGAPIVMDAAQTLQVCAAAPSAVVVAIHLDSLDHGQVSRADLRAAAEAAGVDSRRLLIPADGETLAL